MPSLICRWKLFFFSTSPSLQKEGMDKGRALRQGGRWMVIKQEVVQIQINQIQIHQIQINQIQIGQIQIHQIQINQIQINQSMINLQL